MKRLLSTLGIILLFNASLLNAANMVIVPDQFKTIQEAVDYAQKYSLEVVVKSGTYYESVVVHEGITLRSMANMNEYNDFSAAKRTIIDGGKNSDAVVKLKNKSILRGFTITGVKPAEKSASPNHAVYIDEGSPVITNCIIRNNDSTGIGNHGRSASPFIINNMINNNNGPGIGNSMGSTAKIVGNFIFSNAQLGIACTNNSKPQILENTIYENMWAGIGVTNAAYPTIQKNEIFSNGYEGMGLGIAVSGGKATIKDNVIYNNKMAGIGLKNEAEGTITNNESFGNKIGIVMHTAQNTVIENNKIYENMWVGIAVNNSNSPQIHGNEIFSNGSNGSGLGIAVNGGSVDIKRNSFYYNELAGIGLKNKAGGSISDNEAFSNKIGIVMRGTKDTKIENNKIHDNLLLGIGYNPVTQASIKKNEIYQNGLVPVPPMKMKNITLSENKMHDNLNIVKKIFAQQMFGSRKTAIDIKKPHENPDMINRKIAQSGSKEFGKIFLALSESSER